MFQKALPVWPENRANEMNLHVVFTAEISLKQAGELHIAAASFYRVWDNENFLSFGPARTAKGYARVDVLPLDAGIHSLRVEVVGFACCSLSTVKTPSFLQAEILEGDAVVAYTGKDFDAFIDNRYIQAIQRYSVQRHFTEVCDYRNALQPVPTEVSEYAPETLSRHVPYPHYEDITLTDAALGGTLHYDASKHFQNDYSWKIIPEGWGRFAEESIPNPYIWIQRHNQRLTFRERALPLTIGTGEYAVFDFAQIEAGFISLDWEAVEESDLVVAFAEYYKGDTFTLKDFHAHTVLEYFSAENKRHETLSFEPHTCRFLMVAVKSGRVKMHKVGIKTFIAPPQAMQYEIPEDPALASICSAAKRTYCHNAVDIYMDCPSRERAGWLCDSYFTAKTEYALTGKTLVEDAFLENFRLFKNEGDLPEGALPMCYPADIMEDHNNHFIPQWTMWYILEVEEYIHKRGHEDMLDAFRPSIYALLDFYARYENEDGLLECLPSWNFVEWSSANQWVRDVNYPTNFLYSGVLEAVWKLYGDEDCLAKCKRVRTNATAQAFNGTYFQDHAKRDAEGVLRLKPQASQAGQYYAILFGGVDVNAPEYAALKDLILNKFDPDVPFCVPAIMDVNAFVGAYLRLETLLKIGAYELALIDVKKFFGNMDANTKTLWENRTIKGSNDHGFASYALVVILEALKNK